MENKDKLILALDTSDLKEIDSIINDVVPPLSFVKVGPVSFLPNSKELIDIISSKNLSVMFDFKFFDIPNTIENSLKFLFDINTKIFTMHCLAGPGLIKSVLKELNNLENLSKNNSLKNDSLDILELGFNERVREGLKTNYQKTSEELATLKFIVQKIIKKELKEKS